MRLTTANIQGGLDFETQDATLINRTGGALVAGDIVALNLDFAATSGQAMVGLDPGTNTDGAGGYVFGAAIAVTTENATRILGVALDSVADNASGRFRFKGVVKVNQNGANAGEFLYGTNAQKYATPVTLTEILALTTQVKLTGISLEASTGAQVKLALWDGVNGFSMSGGDT